MSTFKPLNNVEPILAILSRISMFGGVMDDKHAEVFQLLETGSFKRGEYVFKKGEEPTHIYVVKTGSIGLQVTDDGVVIQKKTLGVGESFGEASLMSMHKHTANALALEDSEVIVLSRRALIRLQQEDIGLFALLMMNLARELARRLQLTDEILMHYVHTHESNPKPEK
jgi:CRP-like cAMP-binding protein